MAAKTIDANTGAKIPYTTRGNKITFNDDLQLDLSKRERDSDVYIDISEDIAGALTTGTGIRYVARIHIPPREYNEVQNGTDSEGNPQIVKEPVPFSMANVEVTLFALGERSMLTNQIEEVQ